MAAFDGTWELVEEDNFENYLKALDVKGVELEFFLACEQTTLHIEHTGTDWSLAFRMDNDEFKETFTEGVEKMILGVHGKNIKVTLKFESKTRMVEIYSDPTYDMKTTRDVNGDEIIETMYGNGVKSVAKYKRKVIAS